MKFTETIAAIATPPGRGGVGIIRISGPLVPHLSQEIIGYLPKPRKATYANFKKKDGVILDQGILLYFSAPHSFTGEEVLELQGHGGPILLDSILKYLIELGVRLALPGEFSQRAFLNNKIDLVQAESIADLINATSQQAARSALNSLQGDFSKQISKFKNQLIRLRIFVEAAIDFPEEEIDFIAESTIKQDLADIIQQINLILKVSQQGLILQEGIKIVLAGKPNAGKSSLLNCLSGRDSAIVSDIAGTTRDLIREHINLGGLPIHIIDTAGLHHSQDSIELEGMRRTREMMQNACLVLLIVDSAEMKETSLTQELNGELINLIPSSTSFLIVQNKIDLINESPEIINEGQYTTIKVSAKNNQGIDLLINYLKQKAGVQDMSESIFIARRRHLAAIEKALLHLKEAQKQLEIYFASELLAEELSLANIALGEITGEFSSDELLGEIFSSFCIGK